MSWLEKRRKRQAREQYGQGYRWASARLLAGGTKEQIEAECALPQDPSDFDKGAMDALQVFLDNKNKRRNDVELTVLTGDEDESKRN